MYKTDIPEQWLQNINHGELSTRELNPLLKLLQNYSGCTFKILNTLGKAHSVPLSIELISEKPVTHRAYRCAEKDKEIYRNIIKELLDANIIQESKSPYSRPALPVNKKK